MEDSYEGFATMFMRMPMSASSLPIQGSCQVTGKRLCLRFPFTGIEFDLPRSPEGEWGDEIEFKIRGACGDMVVVLGYVSELQAFKGIGKLESLENDVPLLTFFFFRPDSPLSHLPKI